MEKERELPSCAETQPAGPCFLRAPACSSSPPRPTLPSVPPAQPGAGLQDAKGKSSLSCVVAAGREDGAVLWGQMEKPFLCLLGGR